MSAQMIYRIKLSKRYKKDIRRLKKSHRDFSRLESIINQLATDQLLPLECRDHSLKGNLKDTRECHIGHDWLLRYAKNETQIMLLLISTGDHRQVLGIE